MDMERWIIGIIILALFVGLFIVVLGYNFYHASSSDFWIYDGGDHTYYTDSYEEKGGCIYFTSHDGRPVTQCGSYRILDHSSEE